MTFHHVFIYLFRLGLHFVPGLQSAVCSLQSAFCTDRMNNSSFTNWTTTHTHINRHINWQQHAIVESTRVVKAFDESYGSMDSWGQLCDEYWTCMMKLGPIFSQEWLHFLNSFDIDQILEVVLRDGSDLEVEES